MKKSVVDLLTDALTAPPLLSDSCSAYDKRKGDSLRLSIALVRQVIGRPLLQYRTGIARANRRVVVEPKLGRYLVARR